MKYLLLILVNFFIHTDLHAMVTYPLKMTQESAAVVGLIGEEMKKTSQAVVFNCNENACQISLEQSLEPEMDMDFIDHPFIRNQLYVLRLHGGGQAFQGALYASLGKFSETKDFQGKLDERSVELEGKNGIQFRCVSSREERPVYQCWTLIYGKAIVYDSSTQVKEE